MIRDAFNAAKVLGDSLLLLDPYFLSVPALPETNHLNQTGQVHLDILTKAKLNCKAYEAAPKKKPGRGRPLFQESTLLYMGRKSR